MRLPIKGVLKVEPPRFEVVTVYEGWQVLIVQSILTNIGWEDLHEASPDRSVYRTKDEAQTALAELEKTHDASQLAAAPEHAWFGEVHNAAAGQPTGHFHHQGRS